MIGLHGRLSPNGLALGSTIRAGRVEFFYFGTGRVGYLQKSSDTGTRWDG